MSVEGSGKSVSVVIPAKNEGPTIGEVVKGVLCELPAAQIIVVDDGSEDDTCLVARNAGAQVVSHPYSMGNGAAIKRGARVASGNVVVFMDGDGQHSPKDIPRMIDKMDEGYDLVVGARSSASQASVGRLAANTFYNWFSSWMVGRKIDDLTSGFRAVRRKKFLEFLYLLPNGFSYPTTSTMAFFRSGYSVAYLPIVAAERQGKSHIKLWRDGLRFLLIIFKIGTLYSPMKIFFPISALVSGVGLSYYIYTFFTFGRFTNMSAVLLLAGVMFFFLGLISEQVAYLQYMNRKDDR